MYKPNAFRSFLAYRRQALADALNKYIDGTLNTALSSAQIRSMIDGGESESVEFKARALSDAGKVLDYVSKEVASFLNTAGGTLLIGVDDSGTLSGIDPDIARERTKTDDAYQRTIFNDLMSAIGKAHTAFLRVNIVAFEGTRLCIIQVEKSPAPAYVTRGAQPVFYARIGNQVQALSGKELDEYRRNRG